jgi:hypothetical protein
MHLQNNKQNFNLLKYNTVFQNNTWKNTNKEQT